jgi:DNA-binding cell septation regulator SpoVG
MGVDFMNDVANVYPVSVTSIKMYPGTHPVAAFADVVLNNSIAIHGLRIVADGDRMLMCMPNRPWSEPCNNHHCSAKNPVTSRYCSSCGTRLTHRAEKRYIDIVHPINKESREVIESAVFAEYDRVSKEEPKVKIASN